MLFGGMALRLARVNPNTITVIALFVGCAAGLSYWSTRYDSRYFLLGGLLVAISGIGDLLDGDVARLTGRTSPLGDFLDHFFDRLVNISILCGLALSPFARTSLGLAVTILVLLNSYLGTQIEASFGRRSYSGLGKLELFLGLIAVSVVLAFWPLASFTIAGRSISLLDAFFLLVGGLSVQAMAHRVRLANKLASNNSEF
jgi:phosphatidylglycerophosphate synthase